MENGLSPVGKIPTPSPVEPKPDGPVLSPIAGVPGAGTGGAPRPPTGEEIKQQAAKEREEQIKAAQEDARLGVRRSATIGKLVLALSKAQGQIKPALRKSDNPFFKSKFADLAATWDACRAALAENEIAVIQPVKTSGTVVVVTTLLAHSSDEWVEESLTMLAAQNTPQAIGSTITYARRYGLAAMVGVAPEDDDGQAASTDLPPSVKQDTGVRSNLQRSAGSGVSDEIQTPQAAVVSRPIASPRPMVSAVGNPPPPPGPKPPERAPGS
jgi:hypothetical protein